MTLNCDISNCDMLKRDLNQPWRRLAAIAAIASVWLLGRIDSAVASGVDLPQREERAMLAAVEHVAPSVVSIETVGGLERIGQVLVGTGPTTGLIVSQDGYIVSSAFNFAQKPSSIVVAFADGTRTAARLVATDRSRMLTLLKVNVDRQLPVPETAPEKELQVGQWSIAVGRTFENADPNISVGIVSALNRVWGKAVQSDAKISPSNYGGPLVDIRGRVIGVLVPLSADKPGVAAGVEWYDSGIGFAIPLEHIRAILPRLEQGHDLLPGIMGIALTSGDLYGDTPALHSTRPNSPATKAGLRAGDKIVEVNGVKIERRAQLSQQINMHYAGDTLHLIVLRGKERIDCDLTLVDKLPPFHRPFLGILPARHPAKDADSVGVRYVYEKRPAAEAGLKPGDEIVKLNDKPTKSPDELAEQLAVIAIGDKVRLEVRRGKETLNVETSLAGEPDTIPAELPVEPVAKEAAAEKPPKTGVAKIKVGDFKNQCLAYVPTGYDSDQAAGLVVWLHGAGGNKEEELLATWKEACDRDGFILLAPESAEKAKWSLGEIEFVAAALEQARADYNIDPWRIMIHGYQSGGTLATVLGMSEPDAVAGVAAVGSSLSGQVPENSPETRLDFYIATSRAADVLKTVDALKTGEFAVSLRQLDKPRYLNAGELAELLRWFDSLDKI
jgi:serine protease Do